MSRKFNTYWYNRPYSEYYREMVGNFRSQVADDREIGIEIEVEGNRLPRDGLTGWDIHEDGSLRGESAEYVFRLPEPRNLVPARLQNLSARFLDAGSRINQSYRTSVHVHMNARPMLIKQIYSNIMLYVMCEDLLAEIAGRDRIGNLFCLRAKDAGFFLDQLRTAVIHDNISHLTTEHLRYSAVNPHALIRHGSLEFRSFRGTTDIELIQQWVDLLTALKDAAVRYDNPAAICTDFSSKGPVGFAQGVFSDAQIARFERGWEDKLAEGVQVIQHAAFGHDWRPTPTNEEKVVIKQKRSRGARYPEFVAPQGARIQYAVMPNDGNGIQLQRFVEPPPLPEPDWARPARFNAEIDEDR